MSYSIIKTVKQYKEYCAKLMKLVADKPSKKTKDEIELLDLLIEKWDKEHSKLNSMNPIELLNYLMENQDMTREELGLILGISKSAISQILSYKKGLSKEVIRKLAAFFKVSQEAFNRSYHLTGLTNQEHKDKKVVGVYKKTIKTRSA
jgi:HTH-type transcriptional regulator / antitoxin HigA